MNEDHAESTDLRQDSEWWGFLLLPASILAIWVLLEGLFTLLNISDGNLVTGLVNEAIIEHTGKPWWGHAADLWQALVGNTRGE